jgi:hypothetical protein
MSKCRGQWSHNTERNVCAQCGGVLSNHEVYVDWMFRTTMDERQALNFIPPLAIHQPPAMQSAVVADECTCAHQPQWCAYCLARKPQPSVYAFRRADLIKVTPTPEPCRCPVCGATAFPCPCQLPPVPQQPPKPPLTEREQRLQDMGNQIGRAVSGLSAHEPRLGAARFHPSPED